MRTPQHPHAVAAHALARKRAHAFAAHARARKRAEGTLALRAASSELDSRQRIVCVGDPQAPAEVFFEVLARHGLLGPDGDVLPSVHLVSLGDHFDFGSPEQRSQSARSGLEIFAWLCAQPPERVTVLLGNHDLARVCELGSFSDPSFAQAQREADAAYRGDETLEHDFLARHPEVPTSELIARDYGSFQEAQRHLVERVLRAQRARLAVAVGEHVLLLHAGITDELASIARLEITHSANAIHTALALNAFLDERVASWKSGRLDLSPLHLMGDAQLGEGRGILYHRPADPTAAAEDAELFEGPPRRRFDPRALPRGMTQIVGHIRDAKCRTLMPRWIEEQTAPEHEGGLRHLRVGAHGHRTSGAALETGRVGTDAPAHHASIAPGAAARVGADAPEHHASNAPGAAARVGTDADAHHAPDAPADANHSGANAVHYASGLCSTPLAPGEAEIIFCDGGMNHVPPSRYALLEIQNVQFRELLPPADD